MYSPAVPDGGWGWVVTVAAFFNFFIVDGISYSFGLLVPTLVDYFDASLSEVGVVLSLMMGNTLLFAPVGSILASLVGFRGLGMLGAIVLTLGIILSQCATLFYVLYFTLGAIAGIGMSFLSLSGIVTVSQYFDRRRSIATGIAVSGSGFGILIFGQVIPILLNYYSWRGCFIIIAGFALQGCIFSALLRPLDFVGDNALPTNSRPDLSSLPISSLRELDRIIHASSGRVELIPQASILDADQSERILKYASDGQSSMLFSSIVNVTEIIQSSEYLRSLAVSSDLTQSVHSTQHQLRGLNQEGGVLNVAEEDALSERRRSALGNMSEINVCLRSISNIANVAVNVKAKKSKIVHMFLDTSLLRDPLLYAYLFCNMLAAFVYGPPIAFLGDYLRQLSLSLHHAKYLYSIYGGCNCLGRLIWGLVANRARTNVNVMFTCALFFIAVCHLYCVICNQFWMFVIYGIALGMSTAMFMLFQTVILCQFVRNPRQLPTAFTMLYIISGLSLLASNPVAGAIYDWTNHYQWLYLHCAGFMFAAGIVSVFLNLNSEPISFMKQISFSDASVSSGINDNTQLQEVFHED